MIGLKDDDRRLRRSCQDAVNRFFDAASDEDGLIPITFNESLGMHESTSDLVPVGQFKRKITRPHGFSLFAENKGGMWRKQMSERKGGSPIPGDLRQVVEQ